jgi:glycosyltransferase involved in cell wall biosynthesis
VYKITAVCPTREERHSFLPSVVKCFLSQTFVDSELLIVDEAHYPFPHGTSYGPRVRYEHRMTHGPKMRIGAKRNYANSLATGEIIAHMDDDDWSSPDRLADQYQLLVSSGKQMVGFHDLLYLRLKDRTFWKYLFQGQPPYATGTSQMYYRSLWEKYPFRQVGVGEDSAFSLAMAEKGLLASIVGRKMIVAVAHPGNTYTPNFGTIPFVQAQRSEFPEAFLQEYRL